MVPKTAILALVLSVAATLPANAQVRTRDLNADVPADQIRTVVVEANVGEVRITGSANNRARVNLRLEAKSNFSLWSGRTWGDPDGVELRPDIQGTELRISLRGERKNLEEEWTIEVPSRVLAKVNANVGRIDVAGLTGGCEAEVNVGEVRIDVSQGNIRATTNVGDVKIATESRAYGNVDVSASVGDTQLVVDGQRVQNSRGHGPGSRVSVDGPGRDRIVVRTSVGDAEVRLR